MEGGPAAGGTVARSGEVIEGRLPEETVLLHTGSGRSLRINQTAAFLWERLETPQEPRRLAQELADHFGIEAETAETDTAAFLAELEQRGFLSRH